jgi:hypothetical protein
MAGTPDRPTTPEGKRRTAFAPQRAFSSPTSGRAAGEPAAPPVFGIGRRVRVTCPPDALAGATVTDESGVTALASLADGTEVEIVAWRPRGAGGPRYRIRSTRDGVEGWISSRSLRPAPAPAPPSPAPAAPATRSRPRR